MRLHNIINLLILSVAFDCQQPIYAQNRIAVASERLDVDATGKPQTQQQNTDRPAPATRLRELCKKAPNCYPGVHTQEAIPFFEEWLRIYPTCTADDKYTYACAAIRMALSYSDAMPAETDPHFVRGVTPHHPLTVLARRVIAQVLDAQTESWALNDWMMKSLKDLLRVTNLDDSLRKQVTDLLNKPLTKDFVEFDSNQKELMELANTITGLTPKNEKVVASEKAKSIAVERAKKIIAMLKATYPTLSEVEKHQLAGAVLCSSTRLLRSTRRVPQAESLFWTVEESVNPLWSDSGSISFGLDSRLFFRQKRYRSAMKVLQKSIALDASNSKRYNLADDWMAVGEAYHALGRHKEAENAYRKALALSEQMHTDMISMGLDDNGPGSMKDQIERIYKLLKDE